MLNNSRVLVDGGAGLDGWPTADLLAEEKAVEVVARDSFVRRRRVNLFIVPA